MLGLFSYIILVQSLSMTFSFIQDPKSCFKENIKPCVIWNKSQEAKNLEHLGMTIFMSPDSILKKEDEHIQLINGRIAVHGSGKVLTAFANFELKKSISHFNIEKAKLQVLNLEGQNEILLLEGERKFLPKAFQTQISPLKPLIAKTPVEVFRPIDLDVVLSFYQQKPSWSELIGEKEKDWELETINARNIASEAYKAQITESRKELERIESIKQEKQLKEDLEREKIRQMFRSRNYLD